MILMALKRETTRGLRSWLAIAALVFSTAGVFGQSSDALIDKLVQKGILTSKEADELREETDKDFNRAYAEKTGMPEWVRSMEMSGDLRLRYEGFFSDATFRTGPTNIAKMQDKNRFRYRLRFGVKASLADDLEVAFRISTGEQVGNYGGNPLSGNQTFKSDSAQNNIWINQAYGKWSPLKGPGLTGSVMAGRFDNPFQIALADEMIFDPNWTPEGAVVQAGYEFNDQQSIKAIAAGFLLNDEPNSDHDPYILAAQVRWDASWTKKISTSLGMGAFFLENSSYLTNNSVPNVNGGNTRDGLGQLVYDFRPLEVDATVTYMLDSFPLYEGPFPVRVGGTYMKNTAEPSSTKAHPADSDFYGWSAGAAIGKAGKRGTWEVKYTYRWLGADAWFEEVTDNDFGALYWQTPDGFGAAGGFPGFNATPGSPSNPNNSYFVPGTNVKGHIVRFAYSPTDACTIALKWMLTDLIRSYPPHADSTVSHFIVDATLKF
jgi:hypothetical protein